MEVTHAERLLAAFHPLLSKTHPSSSYLSQGQMMMVASSSDTVLHHSARSLKFHRQIHCTLNQKFHVLTQTKLRKLRFNSPKFVPKVSRGKQFSTFYRLSSAVINTVSFEQSMQRWVGCLKCGVWLCVGSNHLSKQSLCLIAFITALKRQVQSYSMVHLSLQRSFYLWHFFFIFTSLILMCNLIKIN